MNFTDLKLNTDLNSVSSFTINDQQINVKQFLPVEDKYDLIAITLQKAEEDGLYNELLLDVFFHLNIIYLYTDIEFSADDRDDELALYDILEANDIIDKVIANMKEGEYEELRDTLDKMMSLKLTYGNSAAAVMRTFVQDLPKNAAAAKEIVDSFDPEQYQSVVDFATAANGGRNINTQMETIQPPPQEKPELKAVPKRKIVSIGEATKKD